MNNFKTALHTIVVAHLEQQLTENNNAVAPIEMAEILFKEGAKLFDSFKCSVAESLGENVPFDNVEVVKIENNRTGAITTVTINIEDGEK